MLPSKCEANGCHAEAKAVLRHQPTLVTLYLCPNCATVHRAGDAWEDVTDAQACESCGDVPIQCEQIDWNGIVWLCSHCLESYRPREGHR